MPQVIIMPAMSGGLTARAYWELRVISSLLTVVRQIMPLHEGAERSALEALASKETQRDSTSFPFKGEDSS